MFPQRRCFWEWESNWNITGIKSVQCIWWFSLWFLYWFFTRNYSGIYQCKYYNNNIILINSCECIIISLLPCIHCSDVPNSSTSFERVNQLRKALHKKTKWNQGWRMPVELQGSMSSFKNQVNYLKFSFLVDCSKSLLQLYKTCNFRCGSYKQISTRSLCWTL